LQNDMCAYCRCELKSKGHVDHITPVSKGGSNNRSNLQILCGSCNSKKHDADPIVFSRRIGLLI
jgi:5-methylcytosine-specific restriction endonuclease McrA